MTLQHALSLLCGFAAAIPAPLFAQTAAEVTQATGLRSGLAVHVGCGDGTFVRELAKDGRFLAQGLTRDPRAIEPARGAAEKAGLAGLVTYASAPTFAVLPYNDNLVTLMVVDYDALAEGAPKADEVKRVLSPYGAAYVKWKGNWQVIRKPLPPEMGEWTHHNYDASGNPQSPDALVGMPRGVQWFVSSGGSTSSEMRIGGGYWVQSGKLSGDGKRPSYMDGRNAFNGLLLWRKKEDDRTSGTRGMQDSTLCTDGKIAYGILDDPDTAKAWDLATGKELVVYKDGLKNAEEPKEWKFRGRGLSLQHMIVGGVLVQAGGGGTPDVAALDAASGRKLWDWTAPGDLDVALAVAADGRVYVGLTKLAGNLRYHYGNKLAEIASLVALDLKSGQPLWTSDTVAGFNCFNLVAAEGAVFLVSNDVKPGKEKPSVGAYNHLVRIDGATGRTVFDVDMPKLGVPSEDFWNCRLRYQDGMLLPAYGGAVVTFDAKTGKVAEKKYEMPKDTYQDPPLFCSTIRGTANGFLTGKFSRFVDVKNDTYSALSIGRSGCDRGSYPAYGQIYAGDELCGCTSWLRGYISLHSRDYTPMRVPDAERLVKGPAYGPVAPAPASADDWPMMMGAPDRMSYSRTQLPTGMAEVMKVQIPVALPDSTITIDWKLQKDICGALTPPVVAAGTAYVAATHQQKLYAVDAARGAVKWTFTASGRIDSPPTVAGGMCFVGSRDGWVYALRAADGQLAWKFLAAPDHRQIVNSGQLENASPVFGSVMVLGGKLFVNAGRHNQADGGLPVWRLDPVTGQAEASAIITWQANSTVPAGTFARGDGQGRISDILTTTAGGKYLVLNVYAISPETLGWTSVGHGNELGEIPGIDQSDPSMMAFSYNNAIGTMDRRSDSAGSKGGHGFLYGTRNRKEIATGERLVRAGNTLFGVRRGELIRFPLDAAGLPQPAGAKGRGEEIGKLGKGTPWALAATGDSLCAVMGSRLLVLGHDGQLRQELALPGEGVAYGLALAGGRIYASTEDGTLVAFGK